MLALNLAPMIVASPVYAASHNHAAEVQAKRIGGEVRLSWHNKNPKAKAKLVRDGKILQEGSLGGVFVDRVPENIDASYELVVSRPATEADADLSFGPERKADIEQNPLLYERIDVLGLQVGPAFQGGLFVDSANASASAANTTIRYQTFIPENFLHVPLAGCSYSGDTQYFKGDNRGFSTSQTASYRTRFDVTANWNTATLGWSRLVGTTNVYTNSNNSYVPLDSATAPNTSMQVTATSTTSSRAVFKMAQDVKNPFCASNGIFFNFNVAINRSGTYSMSGTRLQVPNHEIYIKDSDQSTWTYVFQAPYLFFDQCLTPIVSTVVGCLQDKTISGSR